MTGATRFGLVLLLAAAGCSPTAGDDNVADGRDGRTDGVTPGDGDGDTIADAHESGVDTDGDGLSDDRDPDSDGDTIPDATEAGDDDVATPPVDSDADTVPDFRDPDSDNDGLLDEDERTLGTDPTEQDTDGDGAPDVVEVAAGTDPLSEDDNPGVHGNFVFLVPYEQPPEPERDTLVFGTSIRMADVYFVLDRSASMREEVAALGDTLADVIVPAVRAAIPDVWFGAGIFDLCPMVNRCNTDAGGPPVWIKNLQLLAEDQTLTQTALRGITGYCDGTAEPYVATLWVLATDDENGPLDDWTAGRVAPTTCPIDTAYVGYPCFRGGAVPIIVMFGDEDFLGESYRGCDPTGGRAPDVDAAVDALNEDLHAKLIGISSKGNDHDLDNMFTGLQDVCRRTGSVDASDTPLAYEIADTGAGLGDQVVEAIETLAGNVPMDINAVAVDVDEGPTDTLDATIFVDYLEANTAGGVTEPGLPYRTCVAVPAAVDTDADTHPDTFTDVLPGTVVCFDVVPRRNTTVPATSTAQLFRAQVQVVGDGVTVLDTRDVYFLVPPDTYVAGPF